jgi:hypothetical protein
MIARLVESGQMKRQPAGSGKILLEERFPQASSNSSIHVCHRRRVATAIDAFGHANLSPATSRRGITGYPSCPSNSKGAPAMP